jgi:phytoene desaturase
MILCQNTTHTKEMPMEWQTLYYKPHFETKVKSKRLKFIFTGQLTVPGPGVPPALISGKLVSELINKQFSEQ